TRSSGISHARSCPCYGIKRHQTGSSRTLRRIISLSTMYSGKLACEAQKALAIEKWILPVLLCRKPARIACSQIVGFKTKWAKNFEGTSRCWPISFGVPTAQQSRYSAQGARLPHGSGAPDEAGRTTPVALCSLQITRSISTPGSPVSQHEAM